MCNKAKKYEQHEDLVNFEKEYTERIQKFVEDNPETRVVFLNADFGWGKTTFVKNNLKVPEHLIYSPWLNKSENYLEDIYFQVTKKDKGLLNSIALTISFVLTLITIMLGNVINILIELNIDNNTICSIKGFKLVCTNGDNLGGLLFAIIIGVVIVLVIVSITTIFSPVPIVKFFRKDDGKYYEEKIIEKITKKIENVLVVEDIDRADNIEEILIVINKISEHIKEKKENKYVLITGDYIRMIKRIGEPAVYDSNIGDLSTYINKGPLVAEKIISLRIEFSSIFERINNLLKENNLSTNITKIEQDELVSFIKNKNLSVRFFVRFLKKYNKEIDNGNSLYHLLLKYFKEEKYFNINKDVIKNSIYNIERFPICLNDIEMMYQKGYIKINNVDYHEIREYEENDDSNYNIITKSLRKIFEEKEQTALEMFSFFYNSERLPVLDKDRNNNGSRTIPIGASLKPYNLKQDLDNYLLSLNNNDTAMHENMLTNKRCYFNSKNSGADYEQYKLNNTEFYYASTVSNEDFIYAYIGSFFRENKKEIDQNYPKIAAIIDEIIKHEQIETKKDEQ